MCVAMRRGGGAVGNRQGGQSSERRQGAVVAGAMGGEGRACVAPTTGVWGAGNVLMVGRGDHAFPREHVAHLRPPASKVGRIILGKNHFFLNFKF